MMKKTGVLALVVCALLVMLSPGLVQASSGPQVLDSSAEVDFPGNIYFNLTAESDVEITDIRLHYQVDRMAHAQVTSEVYLEFMPAARVKTQWKWDMRRTGALPSGSQVRYWWTVIDARDNRIETAPATLQINDDRYDWRSLTHGKITFHWYGGGEEFAQELMSAARQALARIAESTGVEPGKQVNMYIYANSNDLRGSMIFAQEWTGGRAFTQYSTVVIGISPDNIDWGRGAIAHELTHLVIHQITFSPYGDLPTWLDEGLAMNSEGELEPAFAQLLKQATDADKLLSVRSIASPFSALTEEAGLAYTESHSIVKFLIDTYGSEKMFELLHTFKQGSTYDAALIKVYGFDMDGLNDLWRKYLKESPVAAIQTGGEKVLASL
ncbi:peptidase MA family metallohydrolase [Chloroflexota bacterium]